MFGAFLLMGECFINPVFLLVFLYILARRDNEMGYLGAFFTSLFGMIIVPTLFYGLNKDMEMNVRLSIIIAARIRLSKILLLRVGVKPGVTVSAPR